MKREAEVKELFISNAVHLIAEGGFEKATTKELAFYGGSLPGLKMNEVYLYRIFGSKEKLFEEAFLTLDGEFFEVLRASVEKVGGLEGATRDTLYAIFLDVWSFVLQNEVRCRSYVRYYYSIYHSGSSQRAHAARFEGVVKQWSVLFKEEADVTAIMHSVFIMLFDFSIRVHNGQLENDDVNRPHVFNVLYSMMMTYFKDCE